MADFVSLLKKVLEDQPTQSKQVRQTIYVRVRQLLDDKLIKANVSCSVAEERCTQLELAIERVELEYTDIDRQLYLLEKNQKESCFANFSNPDGLSTKSPQFSIHSLSGKDGMSFREKKLLSSFELFRQFFKLHIVPYKKLLCLIIVGIFLLIGFLRLGIDIFIKKDFSNSVLKDSTQHATIDRIEKEANYRLLSDGSEALTNPDTTPNMVMSSNIVTSSPNVVPGEPDSESSKIGLEEAKFYLIDREKNTQSENEAQVSWSLAFQDDGNSAKSPIVVSNITVSSLGVGGILTLKRNFDKAIPNAYLMELSLTIPHSLTGNPVQKILQFWGVNKEGKKQPLLGDLMQVTPDFVMLALKDDQYDHQDVLSYLQNLDSFEISILFKDGYQGLLKLNKGETGSKNISKAAVAWKTNKAFD